MAKPKSTYPGHTVKRGDHGGNVHRIQDKLNDWRASNPKDNDHQPKLALDGDFGPQTEKRVRQFQGHHDGPHGHPLDVDGIVGRFTWATLFGEQLYHPPKPDPGHVARGTLWLPHAEHDPYPDSGPFRFPNASPRGVIHSTEGVSLPHYSGSAPHFTLEPRSGKLWQHIALNRCAEALEHNAGRIDTNHMHAIQIEVIEFAILRTKARPDWSATEYKHLAALMRDLESAVGIKRTESVTFVGTSHPMSDEKWRTYEGWCGHQHVPHQDRAHHWDPGELRLHAELI